MTTKNIEAIVSCTLKVKSALDFPPGPGKTNHNQSTLKVKKGITNNHNETLLKVGKTAAYPPGPTITIVNHNETILKIYK